MNSLKAFLIVFFTITLVFPAKVYSQTDSTDLTLSIDSVVLVTAMDSMLFGSGEFSEYNMDFQISDTVSFGSFIVEFSTQTGQPLYKQQYTYQDLTSQNLIDANWDVSIHFGRHETAGLYKVSLTILNYAGVTHPTIIKTY